MSLQLVWTIVNDIGDYHDIYSRTGLKQTVTALLNILPSPCIVAELINDPGGPGQEVLTKRFLDILSQEDVIIT